MKNKVAQQQHFITKDNELAKRTFEMNERLYQDKVISAEEYRQAQSILLNKQKADPRMELNLLSQQNQIRDKQKEMDQLNHDMLQGDDHHKRYAPVGAALLFHCERNFSK